jgi:selenocysteine lyase/cysteine desulfurase
MRERGILKKVEVLKHRRGVVPIEAYEKAIDDDTALVSVDYVSWLSGSREKIREIAELAHKRGALMVVDAFHALGVFPFNVKSDGIDVLVSGFYKWLCGPHGVACVYIEENLLEELDPAYLGWHGIEGNVIERLQGGRDPFDVPFSLRSAKPSHSAARFEWGTWATVSVKGAIEAMKFAIKNNPGYRFKIIRELKQELTGGLEKIGATFMTPTLESNPGGGIVTFRAKKLGEIVAKLMKRKIIVSGRFGYVRVSPHFYNTEQEIERFLTAIRTIKE